MPPGSTELPCHPAGPKHLACWQPKAAARSSLLACCKQRPIFVEGTGFSIMSGSEIHVVMLLYIEEHILKAALVGIHGILARAVVQATFKTTPVVFRT